MKRVLVTGGGGFVGQWLTRELLFQGIDVFIAGVSPVKPSALVLTPDEQREVRWTPTDVRYQGDVEAAVDLSKPDVVFHLAGVAFPPASDRDPAASYDVNALGASRVLSALARRRAAGTLDPTVLIVGTGLQYGPHDADEMPLRETAEQRPLSVYAASKSAQEIIALQAYRAHSLRVVCTRSFNHSGVGHGTEYLVPSLVRRAKELKLDGGLSLAVGSDVVRDYLHVTDVVHAYLGLAERGRPGEVYNVASGVGVSVRRLAEDILLRAGVSADISTEASLVRATDVPVLVGSPEKLMHDTGWAPRKTHADIIDDLLNAATD